MGCKSSANKTKCISPQEICDGKRDCPEGDDEKEELCSEFLLMDKCLLEQDDLITVFIEKQFKFLNHFFAMLVLCLTRVQAYKSLMYY